MASLLAVSPAARAQQHPGVRQIEQIWGDANPLSVSLHRAPDRLGPVTGFDGVFHDPAEPGRLFRYDNAITAVFDASQYAGDGQGGVIALIPPGTIFRIGPRSAYGFGSDAARGSGGTTPAVTNLLSARLPALRPVFLADAGRVPAAPVAASRAIPTTEPLTMWSSDSVRAARVRRLFSNAEDAESR